MKREQNMSTASNSVMQPSPYPTSAPINTALYLGDERKARKPERTEFSFLDTIVGRRGSLRSILAQVEAVAGTNTTVLITGETGTGQGSHRAGDSRAQPAPKPKSGEGELRRDACRPPRKRALRTRAWRLYRGHQFSCRPVCVSGSRHSLSRRNRRHAVGASA